MKILHFLPALNGGGIERVLLRYILKSYEEGIGEDYTHSFIIHDDNVGMVELRLLDIGCDIYRVPPKYSNLVRFVLEFYKILRLNKPDILHLHQNYSSWLALLIGKFYGCKIIVHGHQYYFRETFFQRIHNRFSALIIDRADMKLACTQESYRWLWRENASEFGIIYNSFNFLDFEFSNKVRERIREKLGIKSDVVLLGVGGRLSKQQNYPFVFEIIKNLPTDKYSLLIIGEGEEEKALKNIADKLSLSNIIWLDPSERVFEFMCSMDLLLMPSLWEGLGIVGIEAQINGLPVYVADHLPSDLDFSHLVKRISIYEPNSLNLWLKAIRSLDKNEFRESTAKDMDNNSYNINVSWKKLFETYDDIYKT